MHLLLIIYQRSVITTSYGARPIKRKIQTQIENELSKLIISDDIIKGGSYTISFTDGRLVSTLNQKQIQSNPSS